MTTQNNTSTEQNNDTLYQEMIDDLIRIVIEVYPHAHTVLLVEDEGHDRPEDSHGHLHSIRDHEGKVIVLGSHEDYLESEWSWDADDYIYAIHHNKKLAFTQTLPDDKRKILTLTIK